MTATGAGAEAGATPPRPSWRAGLLALRQAPWVRAAERALSLLVVGLSLYYVARQLAPMLARADGAALWPSASALQGAFAVVSVCNLLTGAVWYLLLSSLGYSLSLPRSVALHLTANIAKYLPGGVWQLVGKAALAERRGVPIRRTGVSIALEVGLWVATGLLASLILAPAEPGMVGWTVLAGRWRWPLAGLGGGLLLALPLALGRVPKLIPPAADGERRPRVARMWLAMALMLAHWALMGLALKLLVEGIPNSPLLPWSRATYALALSSTAGLLVVVAPAGIGVREAVLTGALGSTLTPGVAAAAALVSRALFVATEVVAFLFMVIAQALADRWPRASQATPSTAASAAPSRKREAR